MDAQSLLETNLLKKLHLQQIGQLLIKRGIELGVEGDPSGELTRFVNKVYADAKIPLYLDDIWQRGAKEGALLLYIRPIPGSYRIEYHEPSNFEVTFNPDTHEISLATITWDVMVEKKTIYKKLVLSSELITYWESERGITPNVEPTSSLPNPYGIVPAVLINNRPQGPCKLGKSEFEDFQSELLNWQLADQQIQDNITRFGGPILYTSRSRQELEEAGVIRKVSVDEVSGYYGLNDPIYVTRSGVQLKSIVDNFDPDDILGYLTPDPLTPEHISYVSSLRKQVRTLLGSADEFTLSAESSDSFVIRTPEELRLALAFPINTARKRSHAYFTYGIAKAFQAILWMASVDGLVPSFTSLPMVTWRYLGEMWHESAREKLDQSIVARNMLRLGVNVREVLSFLFPDKKAPEIEAMIAGGFAYEFLKGIAEVSQGLVNSRDAEGNLPDFVQQYLDAEVSSNGN